MPQLSDIQTITSGDRHPARTMSFDELYDGLQERVKSGLIRVRSYPAKRCEIYNYTPKCQQDNLWDRFTVLARGLVLDPYAKIVLATPFPKFFNWGEFSYETPDGPFSTTEKIDGSLGIIFFHQDKWHVTTRGSMSSDQAIWATKWLRANAHLDSLCKGYTYLAEIIYHENRIVVSYDFEGLVLLGAYDQDGKEVSSMELIFHAVTAGLRQTKSQEFGSIQHIVDVAKVLSHQEEGFVIRFASGFRMKIKGEEYCRVHRIVSRITPLAVWEAMMSCDDLDIHRTLIPEEFLRDFDVIRHLIQEKLDIRLQKLQEAKKKTIWMLDRELGKRMQDGTLETLYGIPREVSSFLFACRKDAFIIRVHEQGSRARQRMFNMFRPTGNKLEGYEPTTMMTRFVNESG